MLSVGNSEPACFLLTLKPLMPFLTIDAAWRKFFVIHGVNMQACRQARLRLDVPKKCIQRLRRRPFSADLGQGFITPDFDIDRF